MSLHDITIENVLHSGKINKNCTKSHIRPNAIYKPLQSGLDPVFYGHTMHVMSTTLHFDDTPNRHLKTVKNLSFKIQIQAQEHRQFLTFPIKNSFIKMRHNASQIKSSRVLLSGNPDCACPSVDHSAWPCVPWNRWVKTWNFWQTSTRNSSLADKNDIACQWPGLGAKTKAGKIANAEVKQWYQSWWKVKCGKTKWVRLNKWS